MGNSAAAAAAAGYDDTELTEERAFGRGAELVWVLFFVFCFFYTTVRGRLQRLNYRVSCIVVLPSFTVIAHHLTAHSYNQITRHRNVPFQWVYV